MIERPQFKVPKKPFKTRYHDPLNTGNELVDAIGCVKVDGFRIDPNWRKHPRLISPLDATGEDHKTGKANLTYQLVWAFVVDMYISYKWIDPKTGEVRHRNKFEGEMWATTYARLARLLGVGKDAVDNAIELMEKNGLVATRERRDLRDPEKPRERPFEIWPIPEMVREVTGRGNHPVELSEHLDTGNWVCNELAQIKIEGDVIDYNWLGQPALRNKEGHTDGLLLIVLARLFFFHTPTPHNDKATGKPLPRTTKFDAHALYIAYYPWAEEMGLTHLQLRRAISDLVRNGVIIRDVRPIIDRTGQPTNNKVLVWLVLDNILELTYGTAIALPGQKVEAPPKKPAKEGNSKQQKSGGRGAQNGSQSAQHEGQSSATGSQSAQTGDRHNSVRTPILTPKQTDSSHQHQEQGCAILDRDNSSFNVDADDDFLNSSSSPKASTQRSENSSTPASSPNNLGAAAEPHFQPPLPATATPSAPAQRDTVRKLEERLLQFAEVNNVALSPEGAARIVASWPAAHFDAGALIERLTQSYGAIPLDRQISQAQAEKMVRENPDAVRWLLCTWRGHDESRAEYYAVERNAHYQMTGIFVRSCREYRNPPLSWLRAIVAAAMREEVAHDTSRQRAAEEAALRQEEARAAELMAARMTDLRARWAALDEATRATLEAQIAEQAGDLGRMAKSPSQLATLRENWQHRVLMAWERSRDNGEEKSAPAAIIPAAGSVAVRGGDFSGIGDVAHALMAQAQKSTPAAAEDGRTRLLSNRREQERFLATLSVDETALVDNAAREDAALLNLDIAETGGVFYALRCSALCKLIRRGEIEVPEKTESLETESFEQAA